MSKKSIPIVFSGSVVKEPVLMGAIEELKMMGPVKHVDKPYTPPGHFMQQALMGDLNVSEELNSVIDEKYDESKIIPIPPCITHDHLLLTSEGWLPLKDILVYEDRLFRTLGIPAEFLGLPKPMAATREEALESWRSDTYPETPPRPCPHCTKMVPLKVFNLMQAGEQACPFCNK